MFNKEFVLVCAIMFLCCMIQSCVNCARQELSFWPLALVHRDRSPRQFDDPRPKNMAASFKSFWEASVLLSSNTSRPLQSPFRKPSTILQADVVCTREISIPITAMRSVTETSGLCGKCRGRLSMERYLSIRGPCVDDFGRRVRCWVRDTDKTPTLGTAPLYQLS